VCLKRKEELQAFCCLKCICMLMYVCTCVGVSVCARVYE